MCAENVFSWVWQHSLQHCVHETWTVCTDQIAESRCVMLMATIRDHTRCYIIWQSSASDIAKRKNGIWCWSKERELSSLGNMYSPAFLPTTLSTFATSFSLRLRYMYGSISKKTLSTHTLTYQTITHLFQLWNNLFPSSCVFTCWCTAAALSSHRPFYMYIVRTDIR